jgi:hypothetical protein
MTDPRIRDSTTEENVFEQLKKIRCLKRRKGNSIILDAYFLMTWPASQSQ